jgi:nucleotide-binding universal stress UspA family protein
MTYASVLVPVEADTDCDLRLAFAVDLANQFDAKLIGVAAENWTIPGNDLDDGVAIGVLVQFKFSDIDAGLARAETKFRGIAAAVHKGTDWYAARRFPTSEIVGHARAADLIVTSRVAGHSVSDDKVASPTALVLQAGRPVIIAPTGATQLKLQNIVVGWKDAREARRAVADALPLLKRSGKTHVIEVCNHLDVSAAHARTEDVATYLGIHGVDAAAIVVVAKHDLDPSQQFLDLADQHKADLIVAGGYGHSRFQEWVFGGFTRALLDQTSRAIFLSH